MKIPEQTLKDMLLSEAFSHWLTVTDTKTRTHQAYAQTIRRATGLGLVFGPGSKLVITFVCAA